MMAAPTYRELLMDPRWQKVRLKKLEAAEWCCQACSDEGTTLQVHHKRYVKGRLPWEYEDHELVVLCKSCHEAEHEAKDLRSELVSHLQQDGPASASDFYAVAAGYIGGQTFDKGVAGVVDRFWAESPYQVESGRLLAALVNRFHLTAPGMANMTNELNETLDSELADDLQAVFQKHGVLAPKGEL